MFHVGRFRLFHAGRRALRRERVFRDRTKPGTYKVRNEIETKRNETKRNEINENETKRNEINENETKRNETKSTKTKRNERKSTK